MCCVLQWKCPLPRNGDPRLGYDVRGLTTSMLDTTGTTTYTYDARSSMTGKSDPGPLVQAYTYDAVQNRTKLVNPDGGVHSFSFDALRRPLNLVDPSGSSFTYAYDPDGRGTTLTSNIGITRALGYDPVGRNTTIIEYKGANPVQTIVDTFDGAGRKTTHVVNGAATTYSYDPGTRLTGQQAASAVATFAYDPTGNTTLKWHQGQYAQTMAYDPASRLVSYTLGAALTTYIYTPNGGISVESASGVRTAYAYDPENRLRKVMHSDGTLSTYVYAGDGLRRLRQEPSYSAPHTIVWDGRDYLGEY